MVVYQLADREVDRMFRALADPTRRDIFERVIGRGLSVSTLAHDYEMSFAAVQKHVSVLERAALVTKERHGREQIVHGTFRRCAERQNFSKHSRRSGLEGPQGLPKSSARKEVNDDSYLNGGGPRNIESHGGRRVRGEPRAGLGVWENPRRLERWWGPPSYPATLRDTISRSVVNRVIT